MKTYETPVIETEKFETEDVITTSGGGYDPGDGGTPVAP